MAYAAFRGARGGRLRGRGRHRGALRRLVHEVERGVEVTGEAKEVGLGRRRGEAGAHGAGDGEAGARGLVGREQLTRCLLDAVVDEGEFQPGCELRPGVPVVVLHGDHEAPVDGDAQGGAQVVGREPRRGAHEREVEAGPHPRGGG